MPDRMPYSVIVPRVPSSLIPNLNSVSWCMPMTYREVWNRRGSCNKSRIIIEQRR